MKTCRRCGANVDQFVSYVVPPSVVTYRPIPSAPGDARSWLMAQPCGHCQDEGATADVEQKFRELNERRPMSKRPPGDQLIADALNAYRKITNTTGSGQTFIDPDSARVLWPDGNIPEGVTVLRYEAIPEDE